jgi:hypothetical protein
LLALDDPAPPRRCRFFWCFSMSSSESESSNVSESEPPLRARRFRAAAVERASDADARFAAAFFAFFADDEAFALLDSTEARARFFFAAAAAFAARTAFAASFFAAAFAAFAAAFASAASRFFFAASAFFTAICAFVGFFDFGFRGTFTVGLAMYRGAGLRFRTIDRIISVPPTLLCAASSFSMRASFLALRSAAAASIFAVVRALHRRE